MSIKTLLFAGAVAVGLLPTIGSAVGLSSAALARGVVTYTGENGELVKGLRCGVVDASPPLEALQALKANRKRSTPQANVDIPVAFHVITNETGVGDVPNAWLQAQIDVLNGAYAAHGFSFHLASVERTPNNSWYSAEPGTPAEKAMKEALAIDPSNNLNFYTNSPGGGLLGWATFPWYYSEGDYRHGVVVLNQSLPGGNADPYNEGDTGTHEVGHYLGLFHTFQNGCSLPGDYVRSTAYEASPAFGCPFGRDSCRGQSGEDPIDNFMDYSDDDCMETFTERQGDHMQILSSHFRPGLFD